MFLGAHLIKRFFIISMETFGHSYSFLFDWTWHILVLYYISCFGANKTILYLHYHYLRIWVEFQSNNLTPVIFFDLPFYKKVPMVPSNNLQSNKMCFLIYSLTIYFQMQKQNGHDWKTKCETLRNPGRGQSNHLIKSYSSSSKLSKTR